MKHFIDIVIIILTVVLLLSLSNYIQAREPRYSSKYAPPYYHWGTAYLERSKGYGIKRHWGTAIIERGRIRNRYRKRGHLKW